MIISFVYLLLLSACAFLTIYSYYIAPWVSFKANGVEFTHSLYKALIVPAGYNHADYECLEKLSCEVNKSSQLCDISQRLGNARAVYLACEIVSSLLILLLLERAIHKLLKNPYGPPKIIVMLATLLPATKCIGLCSFILISNSNFFNSHRDSDVSSELGVYLSALSGLISLLSIPCLIYQSSKESFISAREKLTESTNLFTSSLLLLIISIAVLILSKFYPTASYEEFNNVNASIHYVFQSEDYSNVGIQCIKSVECRYTGISCEIFSKLGSLSDFIFKVESISYLLLILWVEDLLHLLFRVRIGGNFCQRFYPAAYTVLLLFSILYYFLEAKLEYGASCNIESFDKEWTLCAELGLTLMIISFIFSFLAMIMFQLVFLLVTIESKPRANKVLKLSKVEMTT